MNTDYIRSLLIMFNKRSEYEIETALAIYDIWIKILKIYLMKKYLKYIS